MLLIVSTLLALVLCEVLLRLYLPPPQKVSIRSKLSADDLLKRADRSEPLDEQGHWMSRVFIDTDSGKRLRPNVDVLIENHFISGNDVNLRTNSLGYRGPELREHADQRILFLGDSVTFGDYLAEADTFVRIVQQRAQEQGLGWETINAAIGGVSLETELAILKESGLGTKPDIVVIGFYLNDFEDSPGVIISDIPKWLVWSRLLYEIAFHFAPNQVDTKLNLNTWREEFIAQNVIKFGNYDDNPEAFNALIVQQYYDWGASFSPPVWEHIEILLNEFKSLSVTHRFSPAIVIFPVRQQVGLSFAKNFPQQQMQRIAENLNIPTLDLLPYMDEWYRNGLSLDDLFYDQCHHKPVGQEKIADVIFEFLTEIE